MRVLLYCSGTHGHEISILIPPASPSLSELDKPFPTRHWYQRGLQFVTVMPPLQQARLILAFSRDRRGDSWRAQGTEELVSGQQGPAKRIMCALHKPRHGRRKGKMIAWDSTTPHSPREGIGSAAAKSIWETRGNCDRAPCESLRHIN